ncbi:MAG: TerC family protein [Paenibacillus dendritiformis]|uniref:TerC family protein n=1 Tax=Paenibacillus dendritiformis TaxID=130049 RepID=UPI001B0B2AA2|nr:TerC family protein [Paenibacillus dendritiformis]MDU5143124.1 TerC family protein [Paenibacillus dendritiformis]GIO72364.1 putative membrane protein YjbE [Paenibacillus dendritiformis]
MDSVWIIGEILLINMVLSGDNAVIIAMASRHLPVHYRRQAVWWGVGGAVLMRCALTVAAVTLLRIPLLQAAGGAMLFALAVQLTAQPRQEPDAVREAGSLWTAIRTILIADFVMSLDNVLAIAAIAKGRMEFVILGIALSIPLIVWGSSIISRWLERLPLLLYAGAGILAYTAGEMIASDAKIVAWIDRSGLRLEESLPWVLVGLALLLSVFLRGRGKIGTE